MRFNRDSAPVPKRFASHRATKAVHARTPAAVAELASGLEVFLEFAGEVGAISGSEKTELENRGTRAFHEIAELQSANQSAGDPAERFLVLLQAALALGRAHLADRSGGAPKGAECWGWRPADPGPGWVPLGLRIGWLNRHDLFLDSAASYQVAQSLARPECLPVSEETLRRRLKERSLPAAIDPNRQTLQVLHLKASHRVGAATADPE